VKLAHAQAKPLSALAVVGKQCLQRDRVTLGGAGSARQKSASDLGESSIKRIECHTVSIECHTHAFESWRAIFFRLPRMPKSSCGSDSSEIVCCQAVQTRNLL